MTDPYELPESFYDFCFMPHFEQRLDELAEMAEPEDWTYKIAQSSKAKPILENLVRYTYKRIADEKNKVALSVDEQNSCWNTGLVTPLQEPIYIGFERNKLPNAAQYWHFWRFFRRGGWEANRFASLPDIAHYYDDPSALVLDTRREIRPNVEHIISDNRERFPPSLQALPDTALQYLLAGAIAAAIERSKRNYKTAIPQYYNGNIQLLLPLCLFKGDQADLALVVERFHDFYRAATCLTLDMAYNNARQLARPDRDWLNP
jgi:Domain of unknown function (DUF3825)